MTSNFKVNKGGSYNRPQLSPEEYKEKKKDETANACGRTHTHNLIMEIDKAVLESCFISRIKTQSTLK